MSERKNVKNLDVRILVSESGLKYKAIADQMGISAEWLSKLMKYTLTAENKARIIAAINKLKEVKAMEPRYDNIKVGDEVVSGIGVKYVALTIANGKCIWGYRFGDAPQNLDGVSLTKTGRHFPIDDILEQMRSE